MARRKSKAARVTQPEDSASQVHKAFRRMAFMLANLVCGIWLILLTSMAVFDENRPSLGSIAIILLISGPFAYFIPYGLVRALGFVVVVLRKHRR